MLDEKDEGKVFARLKREWEQDEIPRRNRVERQKRNRGWRNGERFVRLEKIEDKGLIKATFPPGMNNQPPMPNKVDDLCRKIVAQLTVDPAAPEVEPETDSDEDKASAEFATRFLKADGGEAGTNDAHVLRRSLDLGTTAGSAYIHLWADPQGNGWRPEEIRAHPQAISADDPLTDPMTGMPGTEFVTRYVTDQGEITDDPEQAARQWLPKLKAAIYPPERVCILPFTAPDLADASGVILLCLDSLGDLRRRYETEDEPWGPDFVRDLLAWRPQGFKRLVSPAIYRVLEKQPEKAAQDKKPDDSSLVFYFLSYRNSNPLYPEGAEVAANGGGDGHVLYRGPLPVQGRRQEAIDVPLIQVKQLDDVDGDVSGMAVIEKFGAADEQRAMVISAWNEHLDIHLHPNVFLTATSTVQPKSLAMRDGTPITVLSKDDMPFYEPERTFPSDGVNFLDRVTEEMNNASGLQEAAQGVSTPSVQSGIHARQVIEQSLVALGDLYQNSTNAMRRFWRLKLQLARAYMTVPQLIGYVGDDGSYKQDYWTGADFSGAKDVSIARGTGTMMSPAQKQEWVVGMLSAPTGPLIPPVEAQDLIRSSVQGHIGLKDDPHLLRVRRQIAEWSDGPPEQFQMVPQIDQSTGQPIPDSQGQPVTQPNFTPFDPRPNDEEPQVAATRHRELTKFMAGSAYAKHPPEWRSVLDAEYARMAYAAGIVTMRQQHAAQQQQAAQQQAQAQAEGEQKSAEADKDRQAKQQEGEANRAADQNKTAVSAQLEAQRNQIASERQNTPQAR